MKLYGYWRSSAAYRVRIALNLKELSYESLSIHLVKNGGEQKTVDYRAINPNQLVPTLIDGKVTLNQSLAILEYLEEKYTRQPLLPQNTELKAQIRAMAQDVAIDIHPINNLRVLQYLSGELEVSEEQKNKWYQHWIEVGFHALETRLRHTAGQYCFGDELSLADVCLVPQVYNAHRFKVDMQPFPIIQRITEQCNRLQAFIDAAPENQPDAV